MVRGLVCHKNPGSYTGRLNQAGQVSEEGSDETHHLVLHVGGWLGVGLTTTPRKKTYYKNYYNNYNYTTRSPIADLSQTSGGMATSDQRT